MLQMCDSCFHYLKAGYWTIDGASVLLMAIVCPPLPQSSLLSSQKYDLSIEGQLDFCLCHTLLNTSSCFFSVYVNFTKHMHLLFQHEHHIITICQVIVMPTGQSRDSHAIHKVSHYCLMISTWLSCDCCMVFAWRSRDHYIIPA